jgi:signal transduction histidine kinase
MGDHGFARLVSLACHDLRTPLATINGFAKTLARSGGLAEREARFVGLIDAAAGQMASLLDQLGLAARIESGRFEPALAEVDTLEVATSEDGRIAVEGRGVTIETDPAVVRLALESIARAAAVHGGVPRVTWTVDGRTLALRPLARDAAEVVAGESPRDLGALVARLALEQLGATLEIADGALRVAL